MMKLLKFRVTNFRSVEDSGWLETDEVTALVGVNESGKSNLLLPLWKLHPAKDGDINLIADAPRKRYHAIKDLPQKPVFIEAHFALDADVHAKVVALTKAAAEDVRVVAVARDLGGDYHVSFPHVNRRATGTYPDLHHLLTEASTALAALPLAAETEASMKDAMLQAIGSAQAGIPQADSADVSVASLRQVLSRLNGVALTAAGIRSLLGPRFGQLIDAINALLAPLVKPDPAQQAEVSTLVLAQMPTFVYYSNYGNLDSEIYLPHVIENMQRADLGSREAAKVRTLKVLFDFVRLSPQAIQELGRDFPQQQGRPNDDQIKEIAEKKKEREILLQSASTQLTQQFRDWWRQGEYRLRFQADGDHFRIWVSDAVRPEEIELEGRSTGLQWFLSFYLIFLVESGDAHQGAILLLDEPGLSLHPLSQRDLSLFFENLARTNQLLYTTHSPFLVDADHLERVRSVYVDERGETVASADLRANKADTARSHSIYAVYAALGLSVSDVLLQGCQAVIVEGQSDHVYLSAMKTYLIRHGVLAPKRELLFFPAGGVRGVSTLVTMLTGKHDALPHVILDSDAAGLDKAKQLKKETYRGAESQILLIGDLCQRPDAEIEDMFPTTFFAEMVTRSVRFLLHDDEEFVDVVQANVPIVPQIERYAHTHGLALPNGWKVDLAQLVKTRLSRDDDPFAGDPTACERWVALFTALAS